MARMRFAGGPQDVYMFEDVEGDLHAGGGFNALMFDGPGLEASPVTDLLNEDGSPVTYITTSDGTDDHAAGQLPPFWGPDNVFQLWTSINSAPRVLLAPTNLGTYLGPTKDQVDDLLSSGNPNPLNIALSALIGVDAESIDTAPVGSTLVKQIDNTYGAGGAPIPLSDILWVAAEDAPDSFDPSPYICDGTNDQVQIQAALDNALGMRVGLSPGTFYIGAPINLVGPDNATQNLSRYLFGSGATSTQILADSGVTTAIHLSKGVTAHISDMTVSVVGGTRGIYSVGTATSGAEFRGWYNGSIRRVIVAGPNNGTSTTAGIELENPLQFTLEDVLVTGCLRGIEISSEDGGFTAGYGQLTRCHVAVIGANAIAYNVVANEGLVKFVTFDTCSAFVDPVYNNTVAYMMGAPGGEVGSIRIRGATARGFYQSIYTDSFAYEVHADFGFADLKASGQFCRIGGFASIIEVSELSLASGATAAAIVDLNATTTLPNEYRMHVYAPTGTLTTQGINVGGFITRGLIEGSATVPLNLRQFPGSRRRTAGHFATAGSLTGKVGTGVFSWYNDTGFPVYIRGVRATVGTAPTGASIIVDVNVSGTTIFTTQANRPTIAASATSSGFVTTMNIGAVPSGGRISVDIDQVGSTVAGSDLMVQVDIS